MTRMIVATLIGQSSRQESFFFCIEFSANLDFGSADFRLRWTIGQFFLGSFLVQFVEGEMKIPWVFLPFNSYQSWFSETRRLFFPRVIAGEPDRTKSASKSPVSTQPKTPNNPRFSGQPSTDTRFARPVPGACREGILCRTSASDQCSLQRADGYASRYRSGAFREQWWFNLVGCGFGLVLVCSSAGGF